jgi:hypothetical protein
LKESGANRLSGGFATTLIVAVETTDGSSTELTRTVYRPGTGGAT